MINYYHILNLNRNAKVSEIKKAYRKLALLYHPDVNQSKNANEKFIMINKAYNTLIDPQKRKQYDLSLDLGITIDILQKKQKKKQQERDKKYGTSYRFKQEYANYKKKKVFSEKDEKQFERMEKIMFFVLVLISLFGAYLGIKQLFFEEWEHFEHPVAGFIFALLFPSLLIYGYRVIYKRKY